MNWQRLHAPRALPAIRVRRLRWFTVAVFVLPALFSSGCIVTRPSQWLHNGLKVGPNYGEPPAAVAPDWIQARDPHVLDVQLPGGAWWDVFQDAILVDLIHASYGRTRISERRAACARSPRRARRSRWGTCSRRRSRRRVVQPGQPQPEPAGDQQADQDAGWERFPLAFSNWYYGFNLSWELDLWGRIRRSIESSNANLDASVEDYDSALVTLFADIATNYVAVPGRAAADQDRP